MDECTDDQFVFTEESFCMDFFDDQFSSVDDDQLTMQAMTHSYEGGSTTGLYT